MKATRPRYGRRPDLEARRLLGVEAQDAGLLLRAPAATRRACRALALLQGAAARPSRRRGPLRRVGLVAGHYLWSVLCPLRPSLVASTGQRRSLPFMLLARALVSCAAQCKSQTKHAITNSQRPSAPLHDSRFGPRRRQGALSLAADAVDRKERTPHRRRSQDLLLPARRTLGAATSPLLSASPREQASQHISIVAAATRREQLRAGALQ